MKRFIFALGAFAMGHETYNHARGSGNIAGLLMVLFFFGTSMAIYYTFARYPWQRAQ